MTERSIFLAVLEIDDLSERSAYLDRACAGDSSLRGQVEQLLKAHREPGRFMERPAPALVATVDEPPVTERPGTVIGPYKLLEQIGEGGFGVVFMAEQTQPVRRKVALKVLKPGMDTRQVVARFEAERQALALMDHPNIARVLDGGHTTSGRPYFVMDLVKGGLPITEYCDQAQLTPRERLGLFVHLCQAVQHAHQKGVIHRDLKPSNVLVMVHDTTPVVKVIDFGVAKALGQELTDKTLFTGFAQMIGTPLYMSPEQAGQSGLDIDTRSDIYSLGVLLYELLTGTTPFDKERLKEIGFDELRRVIREEEPPKPSARISTLGKAATTVSTQRKSDPKRLSQLFRGELDWIVMKALEKDRNRRYETASAFAADAQRYLNDEPVLACPPSVSYRLRKFARRNRSRLMVAGVVGLALLVAAAGLGWAALDLAVRQAKAANDLELALDRAELFQRQGKRAESLAAFDRVELLAGQASGDTARNERLASLKQRLAADARDDKFIARFADIRLRVSSQVNMAESHFTSEAVFPEIREALRQFGITIGDLAPAEAAAGVLGRPEAVRRNLVAALDECLRWTPKEDAATRQWLLAVLDTADNDSWRARVRKALANHDGQALEQLAHEADVRKHRSSFLLVVAKGLPQSMKETRLDLLRRIQRAYPADLWANHELAFELSKVGQLSEAIRYYTAALALCPDNPGIYLNRGFALDNAGEADEAIADYGQALALAPQYSTAHNNLGLALWHIRRVDEAIEEYQRAIQLQKDYPEAHYNLGLALKYKGRLDDAIAEYSEAIRLRKDFPKAHYSLGLALNDNGQTDRAIVEYQEAIRLKPDYLEAHVNLGNALRDTGQMDDALAEYSEAIRLKKDFPMAHYNLGIALADQGQLDKAVAEYREAIRLKPSYAEVYCNLAQALQRQGEFQEALEEIRRGHALGSKDPRWAYPSAQWVRQAETFVELDRRLAGFLTGQITPAGLEEKIALAELCIVKRLNRAAVRFFKDAFDAEPKVAAKHRYNAACVAALAGCGQSKDADKLDGKERGRLRRQALNWLRADLAAVVRLLDEGGASAPVRENLRHWLWDPDLGGVRGPKSLAKLPEAERQPWQDLWDRVGDTLARSQGKATRPKKSTVK